MDFSTEAEATREKKRWFNRHKFTTPPPEAYASISGEITADTVDEIADILDADSDAPLQLSINSSGGDPIAALQLYDMLRAHCAPTAAVVQHRCCSAAVLPLVAADRRFAASPNVVISVHYCAYDLHPASLARATAQSLRDSADELSETDRELEAILATRCRGWQSCQIRAALEEERAMDALGALNCGLIHEVLNNE